MARSIAGSAREEIAAALTAAGLPAFAAPLGTMPLPSIVVQPDQPYMVPTALGRGVWGVGLRLGVQVPALDTATSLAIIEALTDRVLEALPDGVLVSEVSAPGLESLGEAQGSTYTAEIRLTVNSTKE